MSSNNLTAKEIIERVRSHAEDSSDQINEIDSIISAIKSRSNSLNDFLINEDRSTINSIEFQSSAYFSDLDLSKSEYSLKELLVFQDKAFIENLFKAILKRPADTKGLQSYLTVLRSGKWPKEFLIFRVRYSKEGRSKNIKVPGLFISTCFKVIYRFPVLGFLARWLASFVRLPIYLERLKQSQEKQLIEREEMLNELQHLVIRLNKEFSNIQIQQQEIVRKLIRLESELEAKADNSAIFKLEQNVHSTLKDIGAKNICNSPKS